MICPCPRSQIVGAIQHLDGVAPITQHHAVGARLNVNAVLAVTGSDRARTINERDPVVTLAHIHHIGTTGGGHGIST